MTENDERLNAPLGERNTTANKRLREMDNEPVQCDACGFPFRRHLMNLSRVFSGNKYRAYHVEGRGEEIEKLWGLFSENLVFGLCLVCQEFWLARALTWIVERDAGIHRTLRSVDRPDIDLISKQKRAGLARLFLPGGRYGVEGALKGREAFQELIGTRIVFLMLEGRGDVGELYREAFSLTPTREKLCGAYSRSSLAPNIRQIEALQRYGPRLWGQCMHVDGLLRGRRIADGSLFILGFSEGWILDGYAELFKISGYRVWLVRGGSESCRLL